MKKTNVLSIVFMGLLIASCNQSEIDQPTENVTKVSNVGDKLSSLYTSNFTGEGTFYSPTGLGNCSEEYPSDQMYAAMNKSQYDNSNACGSYVEITRKGTTKKVVVKILDQCPECPKGNIDLSKSAFLKLGTAVEGRIPITWKYIAQPNTSNIAVRAKEGSSRFYLAMQIRNHRYMIKKLEIKNAKGVYTNAVRQSYNYFLDTNGVFDGNGPDGPYDIRITDVSGNVVTTKVNFRVAKVLETNVQFPITK
jgi:expansin